MHPHTDTHTYRYVYYAQINIYTRMHTEIHLHTQIHTCTWVPAYTHRQTHTLCIQINIYTQTRAHTPHVPQPSASQWGPAVPFQAEASIQGGCGARAQVWGVRHALPPCRGSQVKGAVAPGLEAPVLAVGLGAHRGQLSPLWPPIGPRDCSLAPLGPHAPLCQTRG